MTQPEPETFWDTIRSWADSMGLLLPQEETHRPRVPQSVCDNCPICQAAATIDQVNPDVISELSNLARTLMTGMDSAMSTAAEQRRSGGTAEADYVGEVTGAELLAEWDVSAEPEETREPLDDLDRPTASDQPGQPDEPADPATPDGPAEPDQTVDPDDPVR